MRIYRLFKDEYYLDLYINDNSLKLCIDKCKKYFDEIEGKLKIMRVDEKLINKKIDLACYDTDGYCKNQSKTYCYECNSAHSVEYDIEDFIEKYMDTTKPFVILNNDLLCFNGLMFQGIPVF